MYQYQFIKCKKCTILITYNVNDRGNVSGGAGGVWKILLSSQIFCKSKNGLKSKIYFKKEACSLTLQNLYSTKWE